MTASQFESVRQRLTGYTSEVEQWQCDHDLAMRCMDFELLLHRGLSIYEAINWIDETWRHRVLTKQVEYDATIEEMIQQLYDWWLKPCDAVLSELLRFEEDFEVDHADRFRSACREVRGLLTEDSEFFSGGDIVTLRDQAIDAHRRGECESCSE